MAEVEPEAVVRRRSRGRHFALAVLLLLAILLLALWLARKPIASNVIDRELARRGVPARYEVKRIGFRTQRLEGLSIGDPKAPDLTAEWVEVDLRPTFGAPEVQAIRAQGVRLRGRMVDGRLRLGAVDRLLPAPTGKPFRLPDLPVSLSDAHLILATPAGPVALAVAGKGNLASGFAGAFALAAPKLSISGCEVAGAGLKGKVTTQGSRPRFAGPVQAGSVQCGSAAVAGISGALDLTLQPGLDGWRGDVSLASGATRTAGWSATGIRGQIDFAGDVRRTTGMLRLTAVAPSGAPASAASASIGGQYVVETARAERLDEARVPRAASLRFEGALSASRLAVADAPSLDGIARRAAGTPFEPLARALADRGAALANSGNLHANLSASLRGGEGALRIGAAELVSEDAALRFASREGIRLVWPGSGRPQVDGRLTLRGAGLPQITADLRQSAPGGPLSGVAVMEPYAAGDSRIVLAPVRFAGGRFATVLDVSGPLLGGRVEGARLPLSGSFGSAGLVLNRQCEALSFRSLAVSGLNLQPATLRLCPSGGALMDQGRLAGRIDAPRLRGTLGESPISLAAARIGFDGKDLRIAGLSARLGRDDRISRLDVADLTGAFGKGVSGRFNGASGQIGKVPLLVSDAAGQWRFSGGVLDLRGGLTLSDAPQPGRFNPLVSRDFALRIRGSGLSASGHLLELGSGTRVVAVQLRHDLRSGVGSADLDVDGVRFEREGLQPERLTRLTLGVVADVDGSLSGKGRIAWTPERVASSGDFRIRVAALAAPFGPATDVATDIHFTDLLGLETAPGQTVTVGTVNPGILVENGEVRYRIVPGLKLQIEAGRWPFAGGELLLRPTLLDFSEEAARALTFDIRGLDAAKFVNQLEFSNINATGTFDGTLPMIFDRDGGRIVGGSIASRQGGGTLAYNGQVSNANLGIWGGIAFDALKSIQYQNMTIALDGRIDGEMVSQIRFAGVSRGTIEPVATGLIARVGGQLARKLQRIPFVFNIRITAPFRGLIAMSRSFGDPSLLIEDRLGPGFETTVQPSESGNKR
ncbi:hypothetical protein HJG53_00950 [Sphingomonas sp. ID1715]|uniref:intermembrane phospholipid transport protein YdbH family protein n=1 Tax=Sphingomonas sp. ID1715 TaxID=1656898 RepID=UPI0014897D41|nr:YdbH domain-containing protein [Sphingomonas sp. ID1715]NNM75476.1 hypothetical protein [Sphingomonas sp. ID1715]